LNGSQGPMDVPQKMHGSGLWSMVQSQQICIAILKLKWV
jgi:hypothetical protein